MKKVLAVSAFAMFGVLALSSCKKDYECSYSYQGVSTSQTYSGLTKSQAKAQETACVFDGGTWSKK